MIKKDIKIKNFLLKCLPIIFLFLGLFIVLHKIFINGFHFFYGDASDGSFHIYILEHNYLFLRQQFPHLDLFSPPFFYPNQNTLFYSDPYITITPIYALFRQFFNETVSFSLLIIFALTLDYFAMFFLLKNKLKLNIFASTIGAYLFAFSVFNNIQITVEHHTQLIYTFFLVISLYSLLSLKKQNPLYKNIFWANMFYINIVLSVHNSYAITWYYCFALFIFFLSMLIFKKTRIRLIIFLKRFGILLTVNIIPALILLTPLAYKYCQMNNFYWPYYNTPLLEEIFDNYSIFNYPFRAMNQSFVTERNSSVEYLTLLIGLIGIWQFKTYRKAIFLSMITIFLLTIKITDDFSLWGFIFSYFPGANGMRINHRIVCLSHYIIAVGCAYFINTFLSRNEKSVKRIIAATVLSIVLCIAQIPYLEGYGYHHINIYDAVNNSMMDVEKYSNLIKENDCKIIYFDMEFPQELIDDYGIDSAYASKAMWIAMKNNVYIINGYSGFKPERYDRELTEEEKATMCTFKTNYIDEGA